MALNNGRGIHWSGSVYHKELDEWERWKRELIALNISYAKVLDDGGGSAHDLCVRLFEECGIIPIVRYYRHQPNAEGTTGQVTDREIQAIDRLVKRLPKCVIAVETNNEPDVKEEWKNGFMPERWWEIVVDNVYQDARRCQDVGAL